MKKIPNAFLLLFAASLVYGAPKAGQFYTAGPVTEKKIALTFDDGPGPNTPEFLDLLKKHQVKATFFVLGNQVKIRPELAKKIVVQGHEIANHTTEHKNYKARLKELKKEFPDDATARARQELVDDMKSSREVIEKAVEKKMSLLRMPHGIDGPWIHEAAKEAGFILVNWTHGSDWDSAPAETLIPGYLRAIKPGAIILLHDGWPKSQKSLKITEAVIKSAKEQGFEIVTVGELLGL